MRGRRDDNEPEIVQALEQAGCHVRAAEREPYDLVVGRAGRTYLLEVKTRTGTLTASQISMRASWGGHYAVVRTPAQALKAVGLV